MNPEGNMETAQAAFKNVLCDVGCNQPFFDLHDQRMVNETLAGTTSTKGSRSGRAGLIDSEEDKGCEGFDLEKLGIVNAQREADWDTDQDGIPNWYETIVGTNPNIANNNDDHDGDYYTDLEEYLNWIAVPHFQVKPNEPLTIVLKPYFAGYNAPAYTCSPAMDNATSWSISEGLLTFWDGIGNRLSSVTVTATEDGISLSRVFHFACIDNGATAVRSISCNSVATDETPTYYDLQGRRIHQPSQRGVYIQNGRQVIIR